MKSFIFIFLVMAVGLVLYQAGRIAILGKRTVYQTIPFDRNRPGASFRILFLGDSTALGTGVQNLNESTAGWWGQDFPEAHIVNISRNGKRLKHVLEEFPPQPDEKYTLAIIQIGANDILHFTSSSVAERDLRQILKKAKGIADNVVILHSGNVGLAPIFSWPFSWIYTERARAFRKLYIRVAGEEGAIYINLFKEREDDEFLKDIPRYYSGDLLHPAGPGYRIWYDSMRRTLDEHQVILPK